MTREDKLLLGGVSVVVVLGGAWVFIHERNAAKVAAATSTTGTVTTAEAAASAATLLDKQANFDEQEEMNLDAVAPAYELTDIQAITGGAVPAATFYTPPSSPGTVLTATHSRYRAPVIVERAA
jgi:hypothetical protein